MMSRHFGILSNRAEGSSNVNKTPLAQIQLRTTTGTAGELYYYVVAAETTNGLVALIHISGNSYSLCYYDDILSQTGTMTMDATACVNGITASSSDLFDLQY
jgi:hypothetical protein